MATKMQVSAWREELRSVKEEFRSVKKRLGEKTGDGKPKLTGDARTKVAQTLTDLAKRAADLERKIDRGTDED